MIEMRLGQQLKNLYGKYIKARDEWNTLNYREPNRSSENLFRKRFVEYFVNAGYEDLLKKISFHGHSLRADLKGISLDKQEKAVKTIESFLDKEWNFKCTYS